MKWFFSILYFSAGGFHRCHFIMKNEAFFLEPKVISWEENSSRIIIHRKPHTVFPQPLTNVLLVTAWFTAAQGPPASPLSRRSVPTQAVPLILRHTSHAAPSAVPLLKTLPWSLILPKSFSQNVALMLPEALTVDEVWQMLKSAVKQGFPF